MAPLLTLCRNRHRSERAHNRRSTLRLGRTEPGGRDVPRWPRIQLARICISMCCLQLGGHCDRPAADGYREAVDGVGRDGWPSLAHDAPPHALRSLDAYGSSHAACKCCALDSSTEGAPSAHAAPARLQPSGRGFVSLSEEDGRLGRRQSRDLPVLAPQLLDPLVAHCALLGISQSVARLRACVRPAKRGVRIGKLSLCARNSTRIGAQLGPALRFEQAQVVAGERKHERRATRRHRRGRFYRKVEFEGF
eukprot:scaffold57179_cov27-Tisochrysis_lutea.AAC.1